MHYNIFIDHNKFYNTCMIGKYTHLNRAWALEEAVDAT